MDYTLFRNANIFTPIDRGTPAAGDDQDELAHHSDGALLVHDGLVVAVGAEPEVVAQIPPSATVQERTIDGRCLIPGFVDPHTHMCFAVRREAEFVERLKGTPYLEILAKAVGYSLQ